MCSNLSVAPGRFTLQVVPRKLNVALASSSHSQMIFKLGVVKDFTNFTGKRLLEYLFNKNAGLSPPALLIRDSNPTQ